MEDRVEYKAAPARGLTFKSLIVVILLNVIVSAASLYVYNRWFAPRVALKIKVFDLKGYLASQKKLFYEGKITEDDLYSGLDRVDAVLKSQSPNTIILNSEAVLGNAETISIP